MVKRKHEKYCKDNISNSCIIGSDSLPVQCVGPWVEDKYYFLERYLNASCEVRRKFSDKNNAVFIDLFTGPGRCMIKKENREIASGGMRALNRNEAPFNEYYFLDINKVNIEALRKRIENKPDCHVIEGDSNKLVYGLVKKLLRKPYRYHFAFIDPFGPEGLVFTTVAELAKLDRMDLLIHFPIGAIKRNINNWIDKENTILDKFLGTDIWHDRVRGIKGPSVYHTLIDIFKEQLQKIGYPEEGLRLVSSRTNIQIGLPVVSVKNTKEVNLYVLTLASKHKLGQKIWNSIIKKSPDGQKELF